MSVFNDERLAAMRSALTHGLADVPMVQNARFTALLRADEEALTITVDGERSAVVAGTAPGAVDFGLTGTAASWDGYLSGDGLVQHASLIGMVTAGDVSGGVLASELTPEGDLVRLVANLPVMNRLLESAARPHGA